DDVEARLFAGEQLLDDHRGPGVAELARAHHPVDRLQRLLRARGDDHALARGEAVRLDDERAGGVANVLLGLRGVVEDSVRGGGNAVARKEALHEALRSFELRGRARRAEGTDAAGGERVDDTERQRELRADHDEVDLLARGEIDDRVDVVDL